MWRTWELCFFTKLFSLLLGAQTFWLQVLWKRWRHHRCDNFEDKGVALSGLIRKLSTKAQLGSFVLTLAFWSCHGEARGAAEQRSAAEIFEPRALRLYTAPPTAGFFPDRRTSERMFTFPVETRNYLMTKCETEAAPTLWQRRHYFLPSRPPQNVWITRLHFLLMNGEKMQLKGGKKGAIQHDAQDGVLFITRAGAAPSRINHHSCSFCQPRH